MLGGFVLVDCRRYDHFSWLMHSDTGCIRQALETVERTDMNALGDTAEFHDESGWFCMRPSRMIMPSRHRTDRRELAISSHQSVLKKYRERMPPGLPDGGLASVVEALGCPIRGSMVLEGL